MMNVKVNDSTELEEIDFPHAESLFELVEQNRNHLRPWFPWVDIMTSADHFRRFIDATHKRVKDGSEVSYIISVNGKTAGRIGIYTIDHQNNCGSVGYWIGKEYEGKSIITQSVATIIDHAFQSIGLNRIEIRCAVHNERSQSIPKRLNFLKEGVLRQAEKLGDQYRDVVLYSMLKENWSAHH
jgi:ribosomal-protein-serine acetyltransferase